MARRPPRQQKTTDDGEPHRAPSMALALSLLVALCALGLAWQAAGRTAPVDFLHYWIVPRVLQRVEVDNIYSDSGRRVLGEQISSLPFVTSTSTYVAMEAIKEVGP